MKEYQEPLKALDFLFQRQSTAVDTNKSHLPDSMSRPPPHTVALPLAPDH